MPDLETSVTIRIAYPSVDDARVTVEPEKVTIFFNRQGGPDRPDLPRKVRWNVENVARGDRVIVRPKPSMDESTKNIFRPPAGQEDFAATSESKSIDCGPPNCDESSGLPLEWAYEAVVQRQDREIGLLDPIVLIKEDP